MPSFRNDNDRDRWAAGLVEHWKQTAASVVEDISGWRDADSESLLWHYSWEPPKNFSGQTEALLAWITANCPQLNATPMLDLHEAATAWYEDRNATRIRRQRELVTLLDRSMMVVNSALQVIFDRRVMDDSGANSANILPLFPDGIPADARLVRLANELQTNGAKPADAQRSKRDIAREITAETPEDWKKARSLLAVLARMKRDNKLNL